MMARPFQSIVALLACCPTMALATRQLHVSRRALTSWSAAAIVSNFSPLAGHAAPTFVESPAARVTAYPPLQYLEPVYELSLSATALEAVARDSQRWPALQKRLDRFFGGGLLSERNYYAGLSIQYVNEIKYDDLDDFVRADKAMRAQAMEDTLQALANCRDAVSAAAPDAEAVASSASAARSGITRWLSLVPKEDVTRVDALYRAVRAADANRDGQLDKAELTTLPPADRSAWEARDRARA